MKSYMKPMILQRSLFLLLAGVLLTGCFEETFITYDGPPVVEMAPYTPNGQYARSLVVPHDFNGVAQYNVRVQLIAPHQSNPIAYTLEREGNAELGTHYTLNPESGYAIPANESWQDVIVSMQAGNFQHGEQRSVTFTITDADVDVSEYYRTFTVVMAKQNPPPPEED